MRTSIALGLLCEGLLLALATGCADPVTTPDAASDLGVDSAADAPDATDGADARDVSFSCPSQSLDPVFSSPCAGYEGAECRYGYTVPGCGGRTQTCRGGRWEEVHTDPSAGCFDAGADAADAAPDAGPADVAQDASADVIALDASNPCASAGGICISSGSDCTTAGGSIASSGGAGCRFSDGDGVCCVPPAAQPTGDTCAAHGGVCAPIAGCNFVGGAFAPPRCTGVGVVCCVPHAVCGDEQQVCCAPGGSASFRPSCDRGSFRCTLDGTSLMPRDRCP